MKVLLTPDAKGPQVLRKLYKRAFREATELFIASAYLTNWDSSVRVESACKRIVFIVGTDFGITRKVALYQALKWIPKRGTILFGAVTGTGLGGFHPKVLLWRTGNGDSHCVVGSSNLSKAAFSSNYEVNVFSTLTRAEYQRLATWIDAIAAQSLPISEDWVRDHYQEAKRTPRKQSSATLTPTIDLNLPRGRRYATRVRERRAQQIAFREIAKPLRAAVVSCARGRSSDVRFWRVFWTLWSDHESRFQGSGLQFTGKGARWRQACRALIVILDSSKKSRGPELDHVVSQQIDRLASQGNPARGAWLSEMLCHYLPDYYPV